MEKLIEKTMSENEAIFMTDDTYGFGLTIEHSYGQVWYIMYARIGIPKQFVTVIRVYHEHEKESAVAAFKALTV